MKNTEFAKTLTASLDHDAQALFAWIADPENLPQWHSSFCRSIRKEKGGLIVESPRGVIPTRFIRDDHSLVLDILTEVTEGLELTHAIRVLRSGEGCEVVWTLVKPEDVSDSIFHEQVRWAGSALQNLRKSTLAPLPPRWGKVGMGVPDAASVPPPLSSPTRGEEVSATETTQPMQEPSAAETAALPQSGKKLFIGNLSYAWTDEELRTHFAEQGTIVKAEIARFRGRGGRSRGFGFIEMSTEAEAQTAIEKLHGGTAGGREIIVRLARSQENRPPSNATLDSEAAAEGSQDAPAPQNQPIARERAPQRRPAPRSKQPPRARRPSSRGPAPSSPSGPRRPYVEVDIVNKSGYEIFPRRAPGQPQQEEPQTFSAPPRSQLEASPYMEDTGDIENRGHRPPRRHQRRPR